MSKTKLLLSTLLTVALFAIFAVSASATGLNYEYTDAERAKNEFPNNNANNTGLDPLNKNEFAENPYWKQHTLHGNYKHNTNSCASCHKTHTSPGTAASGSAGLLFVANRSDSCLACHDGTHAPKLGEGNSGVFHGQDNTLAGGGASQHQIDGSVTFAAAPGGNRAGGGAWNTTLACSSCHNAHGSDSIALLNTNIATNEPSGANAVVEDGTIYTTANRPTNTNVGPYILVVETVNTNAAPFNRGDFAKLVSEGYRDEFGNLIPNTRLNNGQQFVRTYKWVPNGSGGGSYNVDYPLWKVGEGASDAIFKADPGANLVIDYKRGIAYAPNGGALPAALAAGASYNLSFGISVNPYQDYALNGNDFLVTHNRSYFDTSYANYNAGSGVQLSRFCAQCHTDYNNDGSRSTSFNKSKFHSAWRHSAGSDAYSCSRCHFAHGTDNTVMRDAAGALANAADRPDWSSGTDVPSMTEKVNPLTGANWTVADAYAYMTDTSDSSANKRYTGLSSCFSCHGGTGGSRVIRSNQATALEWEKTRTGPGGALFRTGIGLPPGIAY